MNIKKSSLLLTLYGQSKQNHQRLRSPLGSFTYCFIFSVLPVFTLSLRKLVNKCAFSTFIYSNSCKPFSKRENKRSASTDVGIWDKDICIFDFLYSGFLMAQFKKDSLNCRNFQTLLKPEVRYLFSVTPETV